MEKNTLLTISERTGYSVSTVSRVLSGKAQKYRISRAAVERITQEANQCDYRPNLVAQSLRTQKSQTIGLLVPGIENPFFATLSAIVIELLGARGYHTLVADSGESEQEEFNALQMFQSRSVDGIICVPVSSSPELHEKIGRRIPFVLLDRYFKETSLSYACTDNFAGARMATEYLLQKGYKNILAIQGVPASMPNQERVRGFLSAVNSAGAKGTIVGDAFSVENGFREAKKAFSRPQHPYDAVFAFSSTILLGTIQALRSLHLKLPKDVGVISFDNNGFLDFLDPAITRVEQPLREAGSQAVETLFDIMDARRRSLPEPAPRQLLIQPTLVVRDSC